MDVPLYHITHADNLPGILATGELWCDSVRAARVARGVRVVGIAHQHIKDRRARKQVAVASKGTLADYVPFYFAPRSPMLYAIARGNVIGYSGGQEHVVHLVSSVDTACRLGRSWFFTDGHADMEISKQYEERSRLDQIDWGIMEGVCWNSEP